MSILSEKDWAMLSSALEKLEFITIGPRTLDNVTVTITTTKASKPWTVAMLIEVSIVRKYGTDHKYYESVEAARKDLFSFHV